MDGRPIGVFDSGMGGISLWRSIRRELPNESIIYFGDGKNCPYGEKSSDEIMKFVSEAVEILLARGCKMIVIACNTATSIAVGRLRIMYPDTPFVGMEPAVKPACRDTETGVVAVLATKCSLESKMFSDTVSKYAEGVEVIRVVGEGFVELVESGNENSDEAYDIVKSKVDIIANKNVDKIVLGCTHYPFLLPHFVKAIGDRNIDIIDPSIAIVNRIKKLLVQFSIDAPFNSVLSDEFLSFADDEYINKLICRTL